MQETEHEDLNQKFPISLETIAIKLLHRNSLRSRIICQCPGVIQCTSRNSTNVLLDKWIFKLNRSKPETRVYLLKSQIIQTVAKRLTCPLSRRPLYTRPKPPSPNRQSCLKFLVAAASSRKVKICAAMFWLLPSLGMVR